MLSVGDKAPSSVDRPPPGARKLRVGMVLDQPFPPDARVEREATALIAAGYEVHLLCAVRPDADEMRDEAYRGIYLHRVDPDAVTTELPVLNVSTRLPYKGLIKNYNHHFKNIDTAWQTLIDRFVTGYGIDILHIHDLRLVSTGLNVAKRHKLPVVADLHENYPALMQMMKGRSNPQRGEAQRKRWEAIEETCVEQASRVIVVTEEAKERLMLKGVPANKILTLENTVDIEKFQAAPVDPEIVRRFKPAFLLCYVGHLNDTHRGIQTVIEAMAILRKEIPELEFVGAGPVREHYKHLLEPIILGADLTHRVHFTGWMDETEFVSYIEASDVCLCPHLVNDHTNATFPNKVYLYHLFRRPIIASNAVPLQRYIDATEGGSIFESGNAQMLANRIRELYYQPDLRRKMAQNGYNAVMEKYNWPETAKGLVKMYNALAAERGAVIVQ